MSKLNSDDLKKKALTLWDNFISHLDKLLLEISATRELDLTNVEVLSSIKQGLDGVYSFLKQQLKEDQRRDIIFEEYTLALEVFSLFDAKKTDFERLSQLAKDLRELYNQRKRIKF